MLKCLLFFPIRKYEPMKDIFMNLINSTTKFYTTLELIILSNLTYSSNFEMHDSADMISFKYSTWKKNIYFIFFLKSTRTKKVSNEICIGTNKNFLPACSISNFFMSYWKNIWPSLELISIKSDDTLQ